MGLIFVAYFQPRIINELEKEIRAKIPGEWEHIPLLLWLVPN
jgi:hypothetical protein